MTKKEWLLHMAVYGPIWYAISNRNHCRQKSKEIHEPFVNDELFVVEKESGRDSAFAAVELVNVDAINKTSSEDN